MIKLWHKFTRLFYGTWIGGLYFNFLLWLDKQKNKESYVPPDLIPKIQKDASQLAIAQGVNQIKSKINKLVRSKNKEEYEKVLKEINNIMDLAESGSPERKKLAENLRLVYVRKKGINVENDTEKAKLIDKRINIHKQRWINRERRIVMREMRKHANDKQKLKELRQKLKDLDVQKTKLRSN